jgi:hypothetical protein
MITDPTLVRIGEACGCIIGDQRALAAAEMLTDERAAHAGVGLPVAAR